MKLSEEQKTQDEFYSFPYHYAVKFEDYFSMIFLFDWGLNYASTVEFLLGEVEKNTDTKSLIDIGCGEGRLSRELALRFPSKRITGVDYSQRPIQLAKALNSDLKIDFTVANVIEDELEDKYDAATLMEVYEHIEPSLADSFLRGVSNSLNEKGMLYLTVPHSNIPVAPHHFRHFTVDVLTSELEKYFEIIEVVPFEKMSRKRKWLLRLMANKLFIINNRSINRFLYKFYKKNLFFVDDESKCQRVFVKCRKRKDV